jgi:hypothetical protein
MLSAMIIGPLGENLTPARRMGGDSVFNVMFKWSLFIWFLRGRIWHATNNSDIKFLSR